MDILKINDKLEDDKMNKPFKKYETGFIKFENKHIALIENIEIPIHKIDTPFISMNIKYQNNDENEKEEIWNKILELHQNKSEIIINCGKISYLCTLNSKPKKGSKISANIINKK